MNDGYGETTWASTQPLSQPPATNPPQWSGPCVKWPHDPSTPRWVGDYIDWLEAWLDEPSPFPPEGGEKTRGGDSGERLKHWTHDFLDGVVEDGEAEIAADYQRGYDEGYDDGSVRVQEAYDEGYAAGGCDEGVVAYERGYEKGYADRYVEGVPEDGAGAIPEWVLRWFDEGAGIEDERAANAMFTAGYAAGRKAGERQERRRGTRLWTPVVVGTLVGYGVGVTLAALTVWGWL